jgi:hypothetical protein
MVSPSPDLVLLLRHQTVLASLLPWCCSPSSITAAQRLGPAVESQDPGTRPLPVGAVKWANHRSTWLPHGLNRSDSVPELDGPASVGGSVNGGGVTKYSVGEVGGVVVVCDTIGPWGRPRGLMVILVVWRITGTPMRPVTTVMRQALSSSSPPSASP